MAIRSPQAYGIRLHFSNFDVDEGMVIVYAHGENGVIVHGAYTGKGPNGTGEFWTASLPGNTAFIEVSGTDAPKLQVSEILHFDKHPAGASEGGKELESLPLPCQMDAMCLGSPPVHPNARDAVGQMNFVDGGIGYVCTGTIINDLDNETYVPYFITAYHCISTQPVTNTLEVVWLWQRGSCGGTLPSYFSLPRSNGGTLLATNPTIGGNDMSFIRLNGDVLGGTLAGWTAAALPSSFAGIHHPGGDWKRATIMHGELIVGPCTGLPTSQYHYCEQDSGVTEGGSSGSGIFDSGGRLMGQLYGVCCPASHGDNCVNSDCTNRDEYNTVYGRFDVTYPLIQRWLEIGGTIHVDRAYSGVELGTLTQPFNTVAEAINFAWNGARIKIRAGSYAENVTTSKTLTFLSDGGLVAIGTP